MLRSFRRPAMVTIALTALATLSGCGGSSARSDQAVPRSVVPTSSSAPASVGPPSTPPTTIPAVADGPYDVNRHFMVNAPRGWHIVLSTAKQGGIGGEYAADQGSRDSILTTDDCLYAFVVPSLDEAATESVQSGPHRHRVANVTVGGQPWYHIVEQDSGNEIVEDYGHVQGECEYVIDFDFETGTAAQRQQIIDSVLATYQKTPESALTQG